MSKGKRGRRPSGHPARTSERRRTQFERRGAAARPDKFVRQVAREALGLADVLEAEVWASGLLGAMWHGRAHLPLDEAVHDDYALALGEPLVHSLFTLGGDGARIALRVIAAVDDGELGLRAAELAGRLPATPASSAPAWLDELEAGETIAAAVMREEVFDDACTVLLEARHPGGAVHAVGVLIDNNLGGMAKDILLAPSIEEIAAVMEEHPAPEGVLRLEQVEPGVAAGRIDAALALTDQTWDPPVDDDFARLRALALMRVDETRRYVPGTEPPEVSAEERDRLRDEFLASSEGAPYDADSDEAYLVSLAIDFCADYVDGRPLRWSPVVVELFMADWIPRKALGDLQMFEKLPPVLDAWIRFAGRKRDIPAWAIDMTAAAIPEWREEMLSALQDPESAGPAKQLLGAAKDAGVDLEDEVALRTFIAGWNARSGLS